MKSLVLVLLAPLGAQTMLTSAGYGYRLPANRIVAAPGQILSVSTLGLPSTGVEADFPAIGPEGLPDAVRGLSVTLVQPNRVTRLRLIGIQQSCGAPATCPVVTTFTVTIPYEVDLTRPAVLEFRGNDTLAATTEVKLVSDQIHVMNTCDQIGVFISAASGVPAGTCAPIVAHASGALVSADQPARPGERLVLWAYGLGTVDTSPGGACCGPVVEQPFTVNLFHSRGEGRPFERWTSMAPLYAGAPATGRYQVHFDVPRSIPDGIAPCSGGTNVRVTLNGPTSADHADICVSP